MFTERGKGMFKINDLVQYGTDGVCRITDITTRELRDRQIDYYVLKPVFNKNATLFVPLNNEALVGRMRYTMTADEISGIIRDIVSSATRSCSYAATAATWSVRSRRSTSTARSRTPSARSSTWPTSGSSRRPRDCCTMSTR